MKISGILLPVYLLLCLVATGIKAQNNICGAGSIKTIAYDAGALSAEVVAFTPTDGWYCDSTGLTVTSCDSCAVGCRSPSSALNNRDPTANVWWNPQGHVIGTDDISVTLELGASFEVKALLWASLGDTVHDPLTLKVERADGVGGPWTEVSKTCTDFVCKILVVILQHFCSYFGGSKGLTLA